MSLNFKARFAVKECFKKYKNEWLKNVKNKTQAMTERGIYKSNFKKTTWIADPRYRGDCLKNSREI